MKIDKKIITFISFLIIIIFTHIVYADSNDTSLKSISIEPSGYELTQDENDKTIYRVKVDNSITSIQVKAVPNNKDAKISISGNENLAVGTNKVIIEVSAPNAETSKYIIYVRRTSPSLAQEQIIPNVQEGYKEVIPETKTDTDTNEQIITNNEIENTTTNEVNTIIPQTNTTNTTNTIQDNKTQLSSNKIGIIICILVFLFLIVLLTRKPKHKKKH